MFDLSAVSSLVPLNDWTRVGPNLLHGDFDSFKGPCLFHGAKIRRVPEGTPLVLVDAFLDLRIDKITVIVDNV